jgi:hypothetical protein
VHVLHQERQGSESRLDPGSVRELYFSQVTFEGAFCSQAMDSVTPEAMPAHAFEIPVRNAKASVEPDVVRQEVRPLNSMHTSTRWLARPMVEYAINARRAANKRIPIKTGFFTFGSPVCCGGFREKGAHPPEFVVAFANELIRRSAGELGQSLAQRDRERLCRLVGFGVSAPSRLGHDSIDQAEFKKIRRSHL